LSATDHELEDLDSFHAGIDFPGDMNDEEAGHGADRVD
jgi:hypothetical protein